MSTAGVAGRFGVSGRPANALRMAGHPSRSQAFVGAGADRNRLVAWRGHPPRLLPGGNHPRRTFLAVSFIAGSLLVFAWGLCVKERKLNHRGTETQRRQK